MRESKWNYYVGGMQKHGSVCSSTCTVDSLKFIVDLMPPSKYNNLLNIGVGEGKETSIFKGLGYTPTGIINGDDNQAWAKQHYPDIEFINTDMHDLPFPKETFDAIYCNQVFEHAYAPFIFSLECYCVLKPGGLFYIQVPKFEERHEKNNPDTIEAHWISHHHPSVFSPNTYKQLFEKTGFNVIKQNDETVSFLLEKGPISNLHNDLRNLLESRDRV